MVQSSRPITQTIYECHLSETTIVLGGPGVARDGGGNATVIITKPDGVKRAIFFLDGKANSADTSQADGYGEFKAEQENDLHLIRVGEERYEIPDAVITGG